LIGIDISSAQGVLTDAHWAEIAKTQRFVYAKAQTGNDGADPTFAPNVARARAAGLVLGAYHFAYPLPDAAGHANRDPEGQAQLFFEASDGLGGNVGELPPALDLEWPAYGDWAKWACSAAQITDWALRFLVRTETLFGRRPIVYTYPAFAKFAGLQGLNSYGLWIASYQPVPWIPEPWSSCVIQQTKGGEGLRLPNGSPCDTDVVADEETFAGLLA
jgi:lysozyme